MFIIPLENLKSNSTISTSNEQNLQSDAYVMLAQSYMGQKNYKSTCFPLTAQETANKTRPLIY